MTRGSGIFACHMETHEWVIAFDTGDLDAGEEEEEKKKKKEGEKSEQLNSIHSTPSGASDIIF